jgi:hypothetical protein
MRRCIGGDGSDTTAAAQNYLLGTPDLQIQHLYLIGEPDDPRALWLTDYEAPVLYSPYGTFYPAVIKKGAITTAVGLEVQQTTVDWTPGNLTFTASLGTASPLQMARLHLYDNWPVRILKCFMPTAGDANTLGCCEWFGGRVGDVTIGRNGLSFTVSSFLDVVTQKIPANVIESTSTLASYTAASLVPGDSSQPIFQVAAGSTPSSIIADCLSPTANHIYADNRFVGGYMVFLDTAAVTFTGDTTSGSNSITNVPDISGLYVGMPVFGAGIPAGTVISSAPSGVTVPISHNATATAAAVPLTAGATGTLAGYWSAIGSNGTYTDALSVDHSSFAIYAPLPWAPTPGVDRFYVSPSAPINIADGDFYGFPYVPAPTTAV